MDYTVEELEDLAAMRERRLVLRALADAKIAECQAMLPAKNWLDMNRQIRAIMAVDRLVVTLWSPPSRRRRRSAQPADKSPYTSPPHGGVEYGDTPAAPAKNVAITRGMTEGTSSDAAIIAESAEKVVTATSKAVRRYAEKAGVWPDGAPFDAGESGWRIHTLTDSLGLPGDDTLDPLIWLGKEALTRANAIARHRGRRTGKRLDGTPYSDDGPDEWTLSVNLGTGLDHPAGHEKPSPSCLPWWIVRKPPP